MEFSYPIGEPNMEWWKTPLNCHCIFAIDNNSKVFKNKISFSNDTNRFLSFVNGDDKVTKSFTSGLISKDFVYKQPMEVFIYKSLNIDKTGLLFDNPITLPNNFTMILRCSVRDNSVLLANPIGVHGLTFGTSTGESDRLWRVEGYVTGSNYLANIKNRAFDNELQTVVIKGDISLKNVSIYTDYGEYKVPIESPAFQSFLRVQTYTSIGYTPSDTYWRPDVNLVLYGLFDKELTEEEVNILLETSDTQFLYKRNLTKNSRLNMYQSLYIGFNKTTSQFSPLKMLLNTLYKTSSNHTISRSVFGLVNKTYASSMLYKNVTSIVDIVLEEGTPIRTTLYLHEKNTNALLKTTTSDLTGTFNFYNLSPEFEYIVTANDPKYQFQSIIKNYNN